MLPDDSPFAIILNKGPDPENTNGAQINRKAIPIFNIIRRIMLGLLLKRCLYPINYYACLAFDFIVTVSFTQRKLIFHVYYAYDLIYEKQTNNKNN